MQCKKEKAENISHSRRKQQMCHIVGESGKCIAKKEKVANMLHKIRI